MFDIDIMYYKLNLLFILRLTRLGERMSTSIKMIVTINEKFCYLVNKNVYEELICDLMNRSNNVFPGKYKRVMRQCSSQCDFVEVETGIKFEAKLPFEEIHGRLIGSRNRDYEKWLSLMMKQEAEYGEDIVKTRGQNVVSTELYKILEKRLATIKDDEHAIFFFPYPIGLDSKYTELGSVVSDFLLQSLDVCSCRQLQQGRSSNEVILGTHQ